MPSRCAFRILHTFRFYRPEETSPAASWRSRIEQLVAQQLTIARKRGLLSGTVPLASEVGTKRPRPQYAPGDPVGGVGRAEAELSRLQEECDAPEARVGVPVWEAVSPVEGGSLNPFYSMELLHTAQHALFGGRESDATYLRLTQRFVEEVINDGNIRGVVPERASEDYRRAVADGGAAAVEPGFDKMGKEGSMSGSFMGIFEGRSAKRPGNATGDASEPGSSKSGQRAHALIGLCRPISYGDYPAELWLSPYGVGVLCVTLHLAPRAFTAGELQHMAYALSMSQAARSPWLVFGRADDSVASISDPTVRVEDRVGVSNQAVRLTELRDLLLRPLAEAGFDIAADEEQRRHIVYSVVRTDPNAVDRFTPDEAERLAVSLAQAEEESHPGMSEGSPPPVPIIWPNASTVCAVSDQGASRVIVDQVKGNDDATSHAFNYERYQRNRDRAFVVYLTALMQRLVLERIRGSVASDVARSRGAPLVEARREAEADHRDLLDFTASGMLAVVSTRDSYNRWYQLARVGNRVDAHYASLQQVLASLDLSAQLEAQRQQNEEAARSRRTLESLQLEAQSSGDRSRFIEALLVALAGVQFWFALADASDMAYAFEVGFGFAVYIGALFVAWRALRISPLKAWGYALFGLVPLALALWAPRKASTALPPVASDTARATRASVANGGAGPLVRVGIDTGLSRPGSSSDSLPPAGRAKTNDK